MPPTAEQRRIVARIDELFAEIDEGEAALERARQGLDTWRRALLKAAVTGELTRDWREANRPAETGADLLARIRAEREANGCHRSRRAPSRQRNRSITSVPARNCRSGWVWARLEEIVGRIRRIDENPDQKVSHASCRTGGSPTSKWGGLT